MNDQVPRTSQSLTLVVVASSYSTSGLASGLSAVFRKSGEEAWKAWVPVLNLVVLLRLGGLSGGCCCSGSCRSSGLIAVWVVIVIACHRIRRAFGFGAGMTVLGGTAAARVGIVIGFGSAAGSAPEAPAARTSGAPRRRPRRARPRALRRRLRPRSRSGARASAAGVRCCRRPPLAAAPVAPCAAGRASARRPSLRLAAPRRSRRALRSTRPPSRRPPRRPSPRCSAVRAGGPVRDAAASTRRSMHRRRIDLDPRER